MKTRQQLPGLYYPDHDKVRIINPHRFPTGGGGGGFPQVEATATSGNASTTTHTVNLPTGITSGELLVMVIRCGLTNITFTVPTGWTALVGELDALGTSLVCYRTADGGEGSTVSVTTSGTRTSAAITMRISGWSAIEGAGLSNSGTAGDPASLSPTWGSDDTLWIAVVTNRTTVVISAAPTNYSGLVTAYSTTTGDTSTVEASAAVAFRELAASSEDPGAFTGTFSGSHVDTIAIQP